MSDELDEILETLYDKGWNGCIDSEGNLEHDNEPEAIEEAKTAIQALIHKAEVKARKQQVVFSPAELQQLESYVLHREREGWYYGRKDYFEKRHENIKTRLKALQEANDE